MACSRAPRGHLRFGEDEDAVFKLMTTDSLATRFMPSRTALTTGCRSTCMRPGSGEVILHEELYGPPGLCAVLLVYLLRRPRHGLHVCGVPGTSVREGWSWARKVTSPPSRGGARASLP